MRTRMCTVCMITTMLTDHVRFCIQEESKEKEKEKEKEKGEGEKKEEKADAKKA